MSRSACVASLFASWMVVLVQPVAMAQAPAAATGTLAIRVVAPAAVYVDGKLVPADRDEHRIDLAAGPHRLRILHAEYLDLRRIVDVAAGQVKTVSIDLADKGVRKVAAGRRTESRRPSSATDPDLVKAIAFVAEGDFVPAMQTLEAVVRNLANVPRLVREHALAYLYLGVAYAELDRIDAAHKALARAQQLDALVAPRPAEFSAQVLRLWDEARSIDPEDAAASAEPPPSPAPDAPALAAAADVVEAPAPEVLPTEPDPEFVAHDETGVAFRFVLKAERPCAGVLAVERDSRIVSWDPADTGCSSPFRVPAAELRSPAAGPLGGVLVQFRSDRPAMTLVPGPDADLLAPDVEPLHLNDLPASTRVNLRRAIRELTVALGRRAGDSIFGLQVDLPLEELIANDADFEGASVRTRGTLAVASRGRYELREGTQAVVLLPSPATVQLLTSKASEWRGQEMQISGVFSRAQGRRNGKPAAENAPRFVIAVSSIEPTSGEYSGPARQISIKALTTTPPASGELVRVVGRYRGENWYGDLPNDSRRGLGDWVIKDGLFAVWVTSRRPDRDGSTLGMNTTRDSRLWIAVTGTVEERKGMVYLKARRIELTPPPDSGGQVTSTPPSRRSLVPADIAFLAPVAGVEPATTDQQFLVRFTKPMDESTLRDRVKIRYADLPDAALPRTSVTYYAERMFSIMVDPGEALQSGRTVELVLLPGIKDADGLPLAASRDARVLKWTVRQGQ